MDALKEITGLDHEKRAKLRRYWGRITEQECLEMEKWVRDYFHFLKSKYSSCDRDTRQLAARLMALSKLADIENVLKRKWKKGDSEALDRLYKIRVQRCLAGQKTRGPGKNVKFIEIHFELISDLLKKGLSWAGVRQYLVDNCDGEISRSYARRAYIKIKADREKIPDLGSVEKKTS